MSRSIKGFSKLSKAEKIDWLSNTYLNNNPQLKETLTQYWNPDTYLQQLHDEFSENTISNFYLPYGIAPNFLLNDTYYAIPMAIEESSVVAAASKAAKFWETRGGFKATVIDTVKMGHVHFTYSGDVQEMVDFFTFAKAELIKSIASLSTSMNKRGGGLLDLSLINRNNSLDNYYQLEARFETVDAMGANFINSCLEQFATTFKSLAEASEILSTQPSVVMSILSNYVPDCLVRVQVDCPIADLGIVNGLEGAEFARKFATAVQIAQADLSRAVTHNKGIMNGIDAVILATGNDFRAVEAGVHAYASRDGQYRSLTDARVESDHFYFSIEIPLAIGTVGGLTSLHPLSRVSLELLDKPSARELMMVTAAAGLAQNFGALHSLVTHGIQKGHMKMHLMNILTQVGATPDEKIVLEKQFATAAISVSAVKEALANLRNA